MAARRGRRGPGGSSRRKLPVGEFHLNPGYYLQSRPLPADGIRAASRRGTIGDTWWSKRFVEILESFNMGGRLTRGRRYARAGQVIDLTIEPGEIRARVQGSRQEPYRVRIAVLPLSEKDWARAEEAMARRAGFLARLLAGEMPLDIEEAFAECRLSLFPASGRDLATHCSCPDWANPCKHVAATYYLMAEAFDRDPFLIFRWRGRDREGLLERLRARRGGAAVPVEGPAADWGLPSKAPPLDECLANFWQAGPEMAVPRVRPKAAEAPDAILRQLEDPGLEIRGRSLAEILAPAYVAMTAAAARRALDLGESDLRE